MQSNQVIATSNHRTVDELLDRFHRAAAVANLRDYFACFDKKSRFLGTDATENWTVDEFYAFSKSYFDAGSAWTFTPIRGTRKVIYFPNETNPVFCTFDELLESESFLATSRGSGTLIFNETNRNWLIAQYHLSFPIPNDLAKGMTKSISEFEKQSKIKAADEAAEKLIAEWDQEEDKNDKSQPGKSGSKKKKKSK
jgi:hypothetical protein